MGAFKKFRKGDKVYVFSQSKKIEILGYVNELLPAYNAVCVRYGTTEKILPANSPHLRLALETQNSNTPPSHQSNKSTPAQTPASHTQALTFHRNHSQKLQSPVSSLDPNTVIPQF